MVQRALNSVVCRVKGAAVRVQQQQQQQQRFFSGITAKRMFSVPTPFSLSKTASALRSTKNNLNLAALRAGAREFSSQNAAAAEEEEDGVENEDKTPLLQRLEEEVEHEKAEEAPKMPADCSAFLRKHGWELIESKNSEKVQLKRAHNNDMVTVSFSVYDYPQSEEDFDDETEDVDEEDAEDLMGSNIDLTVDITKKNGPDAGTLTFDIGASNEEYLEIKGVQYFADSSLAGDQSAEKDHARAKLYGGPEYECLGEDLKSAFDRYIEEHAIDTELVAFALEYRQWKENRLYLQWLQNVKNFVAK